MHKNIRRPAALLLVWVACLTQAWPARAETSLVVDRDALDYRFAESLDFRLEARSDTSAALESVVLRYRIGGEGPLNRRIPEFQGGPSIRASHSETLVRGQIPPASEISWWWQLDFADGSQVETEARSLTYLDQRFDWQVLEDPDLRVWWYDADADFAVAVRDSARRSLEALRELFGSEPDRRIEIVTFQSQADLRPALVDRGETYEARLATLGARVADDILVLDAGTRSQDRDEVLAHELSHIVLNLHLEESYVDAPLWLDEGLAMYVEGPLDREEQAALDRAIADDALMSVRSMSSFPGDASLVVLAYAESRDIVDFLIETHGLPALRELLEDIGSGEMSPDDALTAVYGYDQLSLYQAYRSARGLEPAEPVSPADAGIERRGPALGGPDPEAPRLPPCSGLVLLAPVLALNARRWLLKH